MTRICRRRRFGLLLALYLVYAGALALPLPAAAMQILDAADHAELAAEISATGVNRIALHGDRIAKVVRAPGGFAVEHDAASGDLFLRPAPGSGAGAGGAGTHPTEAGPLDPVTLFVGTEKGFTYRLTLVPAVRDSAQILIRNGDIASATAAFAAPPPAGDPRIGGSLSRPMSREGRPRIAALVTLVRAAARREPLPGYAIHAGGGGLAAGVRLIETWRGPRLAALVLEADSLPSASGDGTAAGLAGTIGSLPGVGTVAALWLAPPATGPSGGRLGVAVVETAGAGGPQ